MKTALYLDDEKTPTDTIPNYNPWALRPGQVSKETVNAVKTAQTKSNVGSHNLRKAQ